MTIHRVPLLACCASLAFACGDGHDHSHADAATQSVAINFAAMVGGEPFACSDGDGPRAYSNLGSESSTATFKDFRLYVSDLRLIDEAGDEVEVVLDESAWQLEDVALLDFEDGTGGCVDVGNSPINEVVTGAVAPGNYDGLAFDLAVPFEKNHLDASAADTPAPLNIMALFWTWQAGHKYARIDLDVQGAAGWNVHLGSTGCVSDGPSEAPSTECGKPNVAEINLAGFHPSVDTVAIDAAALLADSDLTVNSDGPPGCQSFPLDVDECTALYPNLGMRFDTGACESGCADQTVFSVMP